MNSVSLAAYSDCFKKRHQFGRCPDQLTDFPQSAIGIVAMYQRARKNCVSKLPCGMSSALRAKKGICTTQKDCAAKGNFQEERQKVFPLVDH